MRRAVTPKKSSTFPEPIDFRRSWVPRRKDPTTSQRVGIVMISPVLCQRDLQLFTLATMHLGKGNTQIFQGPFDTRYKLTLRFRNLKCHHGPTVIMETYGNQVLNDAFDWFQLSVGPLHLQTHLVVLSPRPPMQNRNRHAWYLTRHTGESACELNKS